ncbi:MAG: formate dehydrogenase (NAD+) [Watsoniomyces obsoletus]|nr:MAG: formate dehydrogenase (NAD+) [Watsoniomyces obsoletus]
MHKAVVLQQVEGKPGQLIDVPTPSPQPNEVLVRITAAALNHRDLFIRQHLYPSPAFDVPLLADGVGTVISTGSAELDSIWKGKRVILTPGRGWDRSAEGPDSETGQYAILGGTKHCPLGTLQEFIAVDANELLEAPFHLSDEEAASLPLTGLTAYRALFTKSGNCKPGYNVLITGIGGGVALMDLQFASAAGCNVFVTSSSKEKLERAKQMGASGGVLYTEESWEKKLVEQLPSQRRWLDAVIDGAGGDIVERTSRILKHGGVIVSYGMTLGPKVLYSMGAVMKNIELRGSTMGSRQEFADMVKLVQTKHLRPVISKVVQGIEDIAQTDELFDEMKSGRQFGKLVVRISKTDEASQSKL